MSNNMHQDERIKAHNKRLLDAIREGYNCVPIPLVNYFYPPRPIIKKDADALDFLLEKKAKLTLVE